jgi:hypothetical protein
VKAKENLDRAKTAETTLLPATPGEHPAENDADAYSEEIATEERPDDETSEQPT